MSLLTAPPTGVLRHVYERDGFVVVRDLLPRSYVMELRQHAEALVSETRQGEPLRFVQHAYNKDRTLKLVKASGLAEHDARFHALATQGRLVDVVEELLGNGARRFRDVMVVKPARTGGSFSYHQDSAYWDVEPKALVSCWIPLGDVAAEASCLRVVAGSHRTEVEHHLYLGRQRRVPSPVTRLLRHLVSLAGTGDNPVGTGGNLLAWKAKRWLLSQAGRYIPVLTELQDFRIPPERVDPSREVMLPVKAGDAVFFHSLLWHASGPNRTDSARFAEIISFMGADARFLGRGSGSFPPARPR